METFTQTSEGLYERHLYKMVFSDGNHIIVDNYQDVYEILWKSPKDYLNYVEVLDKPLDKTKKGFK